ncbi:MAG TPA: hypothetical protein VGJ81_17670 [Thermoanaerobaculia bacterium]|jgi:YHS domain-containing protein
MDHPGRSLSDWRDVRTFDELMKKFAVLLLIAAACGQTQSPAARARPKVEMRTLDGADTRPVVIDPPPVLTDEAPPPKPHDPTAAQNQVPLTEADEQLRARLPFAPAIGLDPVDGAKISIRADTPTVELKNRIYYFSSEENKRTFMASPQQYLKGVFR